MNSLNIKNESDFDAVVSKIYRSIQWPDFLRSHASSLNTAISSCENLGTELEVRQAVLEAARVVALTKLTQDATPSQDSVDSSTTDSTNKATAKPDYMATLDATLRALCDADSPTPEEIRRRDRAVVAYAKAIEAQTGGQYTVVCTGSAASGLEGRGSDLDLGIAKIGGFMSATGTDQIENDIPRGVTPASVNRQLVMPDMNSWREKGSMLDLLRSAHRWPVTSSRVVELIVRQTVRIPLVKLKYESVLDVDMSILSLTSHHNPRLVNAWAAHCPHFLSLARLVKMWAKRRAIVGGYHFYLNSWTLVLMVVQYLQLLGLMPVVHTSSPECPIYNHSGSAQLLQSQSLVREGAANPSQFMALRTTKQTELLMKPLATSGHKTSSASGPSLAELFCGFFNFYANVFEAERHAINVRRGFFTEKKHFMTHKWAYKEVLFVEQPFEPTNNVAGSVKPERWSSAKAELERAAVLLAAGVDVETVMEPWERSCKKLGIMMVHGPPLLQHMIGKAPWTQAGDADAAHEVTSVIPLVMYAKLVSTLRSGYLSLGYSSLGLFGGSLSMSRPSSALSSEFIQHVTAACNLIETTLQSAITTRTHAMLARRCSCCDGLDDAKDCKRLTWLAHTLLKKIGQDLSETRICGTRSDGIKTTHEIKQSWDKHRTPATDVEPQVLALFL